MLRFSCWHVNKSFNKSFKYWMDDDYDLTKSTPGKRPSAVPGIDEVALIWDIRTGILPELKEKTHSGMWAREQFSDELLSFFFFQFSLTQVTCSTQLPHNSHILCIYWACRNEVKLSHTIKLMHTPVDLWTCTYSNTCMSPFTWLDGTIALSHDFSFRLYKITL